MTSRALIACRSSPRTRGSSRAAKQSGGKLLGTSGAKMGNVHLKRAFSEAAVLFLRHATGGKKFLATLEKKHGEGKALSILAHKIGRAVFYSLARDTVFSMEKFWPHSGIARGPARRLSRAVGTELAPIAMCACAIKRPSFSIMSPRSGSRHA